jgi:hypothetical protein
MSPLSNVPERRSRQLANLVAGKGAAGPGNGRVVKHGAYAQIAEQELEAKAGKLFAALSADAPVRADDGGLPAHDVVLVRMLAETLIRRERVRVEELRHGLEVADGPRKGALRGVVEYGLSLDRQAMELLDRLGMSPTSRAKLGLDLVRAASAGDQLEAHLRAQYGADQTIDGRAS